jgi:hypothetical protein
MFNNDNIYLKLFYVYFSDCVGDNNTILLKMWLFLNLLVAKEGSSLQLFYILLRLMKPDRVLSVSGPILGP